MINYRSILIMALIIVLFPLGAIHAKEEKKITSVYDSVKSTACSLRMSVPASLKEHVVMTAIIPEATSLSGAEKTPSIDPTLLTPICQFDIDDDSLYNPSTPLHLSLNYTDDKGYRPRIYFWDGGKQKWIALPSVMDRIKKVVTADIHLPYARVAVLIEEHAMHEGTASWYTDKRYPQGAATDLYPVGTHLKITNTDTGTTTTVTTTSTWSNPDKTRVLDIVKDSFIKIADPKKGLVHVRIEKLF